MELKELKDMIEPVENWEYEFSGTREVGKSYMQNLLNNKDKVINDLLKRISDLEFEVERLEKVVNKTIESVQEHYDNSYSTDDVNDIGSGTYDDLMEILKGEDKE